MISLGPIREYIFPIENPITGDNLPRHKMPRAFHVKEIVALKIDGSGTFDWELRFSPNANDQGAGTLLHSDTAESNVTTGAIHLPPFTYDPGPGDPPIIPKGDWVWIEIPATSTGITRIVGLHLTMSGVRVGP